jgi:hypothetical protein
MPSTGQDMHSSRTLALRPHQVTTGQAPRTRPRGVRRTERSHSGWRYEDLPSPGIGRQSELSRYKRVRTVRDPPTANRVA